MEGIERLELEVLEMKDFAVSNIFNNIKNKPELQEKFNNKEKTIKGMYEYVYEKAKALKQGNVAMVNDQVVYLWATNYFKYTNEELGIKKKDLTPETNKKETKKEDEKEEKKSEEKEYNPQISMFEEVQK